MNKILLQDAQSIKSLLSCITIDTKQIVDKVIINNRLRTVNFSKKMPWDVVFTALDEQLPPEEFESILVDRKIWEFIAPFHKETGTLCLITRKENLKVISKSHIEKPHYVHAALGTNGLIKPQVFPYQDSLDLADYDVISLLCSHAEKIYGEIYSSINQVLVLVIDGTLSNIKGISARLYNHKFELCDENDWTPYILAEPSYEDSINEISTTQIDNDNSISMFKIKDHLTSNSEETNDLVNPKESQENEKNVSEE